MGMGLKSRYRLQITFQLEVYLLGCHYNGLVENIANLFLTLSFDRLKHFILMLKMNSSRKIMSNLALGFFDGCVVAGKI